MATPLEISIAVWYYTRSVDYGDWTGDNNFLSTGVQSVLQHFANMGLLERTSEGSAAQYKGTKGLQAYVEALCSLPFPVQRWMVPETSGTVVRKPDDSDKLTNELMDADRRFRKWPR